MNTFKFLNSYPISSDSIVRDMSALRTKLFEIGICWTDDAQGKFAADKSFRVVLHTRYGKLDFKNPMIKECNGLVIEYNNGWNLLAMPQYGFCTTKISMKKLNDIYSSGGYDVYEVLDATILTLYYYKAKWCMSSTKGYDIGSTEMLEGTTFMDALQDLMDTKYRSFKLADLDKNCSYTIALRYSKYHIFDETKHLANRTKNVPKAGVDMNSYIMVMSVANTTTMQCMNKHVAGLPQQNPLIIKEGNAHALTSYARLAYAKYAKAHRLQNFKYKPLYGYILRAKVRSVPDEYSTIYIESELYRAIKVGLYKDNQAIRSMDYNRLVVQMSMNHERYEQFHIMFQQFEPRFNALNDAINAIAGEVALKIVDDTSNDKTLPLVRALVDQFKNEPDVTSGIIKDAIYSKQYSGYLFELLN